MVITSHKRQEQQCKTSSKGEANTKRTKRNADVAKISTRISIYEKHTLIQKQKRAEEESKVTEFTIIWICVAIDTSQNAYCHCHYQMTPSPNLHHQLLKLSLSSLTNKPIFLLLRCYPLFIFSFSFNF